MKISDNLWFADYGRGLAGRITIVSAVAHLEILAQETSSSRGSPESSRELSLYERSRAAYGKERRSL